MKQNILIFTPQEGKDDWKSIPHDGYDLIIFTGGYFTSIDLSNEDLAKAAIEIINFKINNNKVLLLLNEDDLQYIDRGEITANYRQDGHNLFKFILTKHKKMFSMYYPDVTGKLDAFLNQMFNLNLNQIPRLWHFCPRGYFINSAFFEFEKPKTYKHKNQKSLEFNYIDGYKVGVFCPYMNNVDPKLVAAQRSVFDIFNIKINQLLWNGLGGNPHSDFVNHIFDNIDCDFYILFDIDAIPLRPDFLETIIRRTVKTKIVGAEQTTDMISDEPFAAPSCFCISKDLYEQMGRPRFDPTYRSDDTQELTHLAWEQGIEVDFIKFTDCKIPNYYWKFKDGRQYGFGSFYEDLVYHNFQARWDKFTVLFYEECEKIVKKYS